MSKHLLSPDDLVHLRKGLVGKPNVTKEMLSDLWYVKDGDVEVRRTLYYTPSVKALPQNKDVKILDCACGSGGLLQTFLRAGYNNLTGIDRSKVAVALARDRCKQAKAARFFVGDIHYLDEVEGFFDVITFTEILEHMEDDVEILRLAQQKLAPNGYFVCSVPYQEKNIGVINDHVRSYEKDTLSERYSCIGRIDIVKLKPGAYHVVFTIGKGV